MSGAGENRRGGPMAGLRVLDLTNVLAGPFATYQFVLMGAEVIKIEAPGGGDLARDLGADPILSKRKMGASFLAQNSGKKSVVVDLKSEDGKAAFRALVATADVVVENFRPGVMTRLGLGYDALKALKPDLIYCAISGFGQEGPMRAAPAYDQIIQGLSGAMSITGDDDSAPLRVGYPVADSVGGMTAAFAVAAALIGRERSGEGAFIDVSMLDSTIATMGWVVSNYLIAGKAPVPMGNDNFTAAPSGAFRTGDGLLNIAANKQEQFEALAHLIGRDDLIVDDRFAEREARKKNRPALNAEVERGLEAKSAAEWETLLNTVGVPAGRVLTVPQALGLEQVADRGLLHRFDHVDATDGPLTVALAGYKVQGWDPGDGLAPPPTLGQDDEAFLPHKIAEGTL
ncbi:CoA transferase [Rhizobium sp. CRIBSB]|nr:CoA transferase [Rhizobium sp. CRIBSB]